MKIKLFSFKWFGNFNFFNMQQANLDSRIVDIANHNSQKRDYPLNENQPSTSGSKQPYDHSGNADKLDENQGTETKPNPSVQLNKPKGSDAEKTSSDGSNTSGCILETPHCSNHDNQHQEHDGNEEGTQEGQRETKRGEKRSNEDDETEGSKKSKGSKKPSKGRN